tara:strand:- start:151 stop:417 length:267 start_codon:yes stop_codon:yes gene_type:complete
MSKFLRRRIHQNRLRDEWHSMTSTKDEENMTQNKKVTVKGYANRKHTFEVEFTSMSGYDFVTIKKNGNPILRCEPIEYTKFKSLFLGE